MSYLQTSIFFLLLKTLKKIIIKELYLLCICIWVTPLYLQDVIGCRVILFFLLWRKLMCVLCVSIYVDVHQYMTPACIFESPWKSGNLSVCFTVTIKIVKNKIKKITTSKNTKKHQNPKPKKQNKTKHQTTKTKKPYPKYIGRIYIFLEG